MLRYICLSLAALLIFLAGCEDEKYSIEMRPCEEGIERTLVVSGSLSDDKRERLSALYEQQIDPNVFCGVFAENLPNDVGGAGFYTSFISNMGGVCIYSERFRGNDTPNRTVEQIQLVGDRCVDFLIGWLEYELGEDPNFDNVRAFCDHKLREDAKNLMIYFWLANVLTEYTDSAEEEFLTRAKHYAIERGYLGPREMHLFVQSFEDDQEQLLALMRHLIADKLGHSCYDLPITYLGFLSDPKRAEDSVSKYIRTTEFFEQAWETKKREENDPYAAAPDVNEISVEDYLLQDINIPFDISSSACHVEVKLACYHEPFASNGEWDSESWQVVWSGNIAGNGKLPTFFYAAWSEPSEAFQEEHFGCTVLRDEPLSQYCIWREGLDESNAEEWDSFVSTLRPGEDLEKQVAAFHFSNYDPNSIGVGTTPVDRAQRARDLILAGLRSDEDQ